MNKFQSSVIVLILCVFAMSAAAQQPQLVKRTFTKTERFDFGSGGTIAVTGAPNGSVKIVGTKKNEIEITATVEIQAATEADLTKLAAISGYITDESPIKTGIITVGPYNKFGAKKLPKDMPKNLAGLPFRVDYSIAVPHYCDLEIDGGKGDLSITDVEGSMRINFLESNAKVDVVGGNTTIMIGSGSMDVSFGVHGWRGRSANLSLASGDMVLRMPTNMSAEVDATVLKTGMIENNLPDLKPRDRKIPFTDRSIVGKAGVGGAPLKFSVVDGKIKLQSLTTPL